MMRLSEVHVVNPGTKVTRSDHDTGRTDGCDDKEEARKRLDENKKRLGKLQYMLYAEGDKTLLVILQAMDAGGKDRAIRHVMTGMNPQQCRVTSFKEPTPEEQKERVLARIDTPEKNWKVSRSDFAARRRWDDYMRAYEDAITRCNTEWAPWFIVPADKKWYRNVAVSQILIETLEDMDVKFPPPREDLSKIVID